MRPSWPSSSTTYMRMTSEVLGTRNTGESHHTKFIWCWDQSQGFKFARQALYQLTELRPRPNFLFLSLFLNIVIYMNKFKQIYILRIIRSFGSQKKRNSLLFNSTEYILFVFIKIFESKKSTTNTKYLGKTEAPFLTVFYFKLYA